MSQAKELEIKQLLGLYQRSRDEAACSHLVEDRLALVCRPCKRFSLSGVPLENLVQVGTIGLLKAIEKCNPREEAIL